MSFFLVSLTWDVWSCVRRRGESAASSPSGSFVQAAPSADSTPKGTPSEESQKEPTGGRPGLWSRVRVPLSSS